MKNRVTSQVRISYALTLIPLVIVVLWCIYGAVFGYNFNFITSLGNSELHYGMDGVSEVIDEVMIRFLISPAWWITFLTWAIMSLYFGVKLIISKARGSFEMSQRSQDIFSIAAVISDLFFLFGFIKRF